MSGISSYADNSTCEGRFDILKRQRVNRHRYRTCVGPGQIILITSSVFIIHSPYINQSRFIRVQTKYYLRHLKSFPISHHHLQDDRLDQPLP